MVTLHGDKPVVKVIDFGIAKATQGKLTDKTLFTRFEQFIGTPAYMSPEQASLSGLDIDTRSDIYALGILLYELLVGKPPFDAQVAALRRLRGNAAHHPRGRAAEALVAPRAPIAGEERTLLAKARHIEPAKAQPPRRAGPRLDRDEGHREGPHAPLRDGQRLRAGHRALPRRRAGQRHAAERGLPVPEVRPAQQGRAARRRGHRRRAGGGDGGEHLAGGAGDAGGAENRRHRSRKSPPSATRRSWRARTRRTSRSSSAKSSKAPTRRATAATITVAETARHRREETGHRPRHPARPAGEAASHARQDLPRPRPLRGRPSRCRRRCGTTTSPPPARSTPTRSRR